MGVEVIDHDLPTAGDLEKIKNELGKLKRSVVRWHYGIRVMILALLTVGIASFFSPQAWDAILPAIVISVIVRLAHLEARFKLLVVTTQHVVNGDLPTYIVSMPRWVKRFDKEGE
jgi:hypothetical protein